MINVNNHYEQHFNQLSEMLKEQKSQGEQQDETLAVMFMGEQFDSFPRELLLDESITSLDKYAWQRLYIELQQNRHYFPSYDNLQALWGNQGGTLSRKVVREILSRLVLSGWLSFRVVRGDNGQVSGNVYMLHNIKLPLINIITQNDESVTHIFTSMLTKKEISKSLAILTYNQVTAYLESKQQSTDIFLQINDGHKEMVLTHNIDEIVPSLLVHLKNKLSSKKELSKNKQSSEKELSENQQSSEKELPNISKGYVSYSSSIYSSTTIKGLVIPENIKHRLNAKGIKDIESAITKSGIDINIVNTIFKNVSCGNIKIIKNMTAYLVRNIQKASTGEYTLPSQDNHLSKDTSQMLVIEPTLNENNSEKKLVSKERVSQLLSTAFK